MHLGYFTDFKSEPHLVLLSGVSAEFALLRRGLAALSPDDAVAVHDLKGVNSLHGTTLDIRLSSRDRITRAVASSFEWELTADALEESLDKIESLSSQGHQYFDCHPSDDAVIMMSVGEYDDSWWEHAVG